MQEKRETAPGKLDSRGAVSLRARQNPVYSEVRLNPYAGVFMSGARWDSSGFDRIKRNLEELKARKEVTFGELFPLAFVSSRTQFPSFEEMCKQSGFKIETMEDFEAIPDAEWDAFVRAHSDFASWNDMLTTATGEMASRMLLK